MVAVPTVRGPVDSTDLGTTLMHEHIFVLTADMQRNYPDEWDEDWLDNTRLPLVLPNWHYRHIHSEVLPALREQWVAEEQNTAMLVDNPRRYFETAAA